MKYKILKIPRVQLYEEIWTETFGRVALKYDTPNPKLKQACIDAKIPIPNNTYWSSLQLGITEKAIKTPLPESEAEYVELMIRDHDTSENIHIEKITSADLNDSNHIPAIKSEKCEPQYSEETLSFLDAEERNRVLKSAANLHIAENQTKYHRVLKFHEKDVQRWIKNAKYDPLATRKHDSWWKRPEGMPAYLESVSVEAFARIYPVVNALFNAIENLGGKVNNDLSIIVRDEKVDLIFSETQKQAPHILTPEEKKQLEEYERKKRMKQYAYEPKFRKYDYISTGRLAFSVVSHKYVRDSETEPFESRLGDMLIQIYEQSELLRLNRIAKEEAERRKQEEERLKEERRRLYNEEIDKFILLQNEAADFETACQIRKYAQAILAEDNIADERRQWAEWALKKADWLDPTIATVDEIFGKRKPGEKFEKTNYFHKFW